MSGEVRIVIPNWERFQHYDPAKRNPPWIKIYDRLLADRNFVSLTLRQRGILMGIWLLYAASGRDLGGSPAQVGLMMGDTSVRMRDLERLEQGGFIQLLLAPRYQDASPRARVVETEREEETLTTLRSSSSDVVKEARPLQKNDDGEKLERIDYEHLLESIIEVRE